MTIHIMAFSLPGPGTPAAPDTRHTMVTVPVITWKLGLELAELYWLATFVVTVGLEN